MWGGYYGESYYSSDDDRVECETCSRQFRTQAACNQHMNAIQHWAPRYECESCTKEFRSQRAASQHMDAVGHWAPKHSCESCSAMFHSEEDADRHMRAQSHYRNYCKPCDRRFVSENNLRMVRTLSPFERFCASSCLQSWMYQLIFTGHVCDILLGTCQYHFHLTCYTAPQLEDPSRLRHRLSILQG